MLNKIAGFAIQGIFRAEMQLNKNRTHFILYNKEFPGAFDNALLNIPLSNGRHYLIKTAPTQRQRRRHFRMESCSLSCIVDGNWWSESSIGKSNQNCGLNFKQYLAPRLSAMSRTAFYIFLYVTFPRALDKFQAEKEKVFSNK